MEVMGTGRAGDGNGGSGGSVCWRRLGGSRVSDTVNKSHKCCHPVNHECISLPLAYLLLFFYQFDRNV